MYAFDHLDETENLPTEAVVRARRAAIVILDQTTQHVRNLLTDAFRFISRRVARADGSIIFFIDALDGRYAVFEDILKFLGEVLDTERMRYLRENNIRGYLFTIEPSYDDAACDDDSDFACISLP